MAEGHSVGDSNVFWAAFGGGAAAGIFTLIAVCVAEWLRWFLDRPLLKVKAYVGFVLPLRRDTTFLEKNDPLAAKLVKDKAREWLLVEASNPHTKPVTVEAFGFDCKSKKLRFGVQPPPGEEAPIQINGGKSLKQEITLDTLLESLKDRRPSDLKWVWFKSSAGKVFRSKVDSETIAALEEAFSQIKPAPVAQADRAAVS